MPAVAPAPRSAARPQVRGHPRAGLGFDDYRREMRLLAVGHELLDADDLVAGVVVRVVVELVRRGAVDELGMWAVVERRDGDLLVGEVLSAVLGVVPWPGGLDGLEHFWTAGGGVDELPFVGVAAGAAVFDEV